MLAGQESGNSRCRLEGSADETRGQGKRRSEEWRGAPKGRALGDQQVSLPGAVAGALVVFRIDGIEQKHRRPCHNCSRATGEVT